MARFEQGEKVPSRMAADARCRSHANRALQRPQLVQHSMWPSCSYAVFQLVHHQSRLLFRSMRLKITYLKNPPQNYLLRWIIWRREFAKKLSTLKLCCDSTFKIQNVFNFFRLVCLKLAQSIKTRWLRWR